MSEWLREDGDGNGVEDIGDQGWWTEMRLRIARAFAVPAEMLAPSKPQPWRCLRCGRAHTGPCYP